MSHPTLIEQEVRVIGPRWSPRVHQLKAFLARSWGSEARCRAKKVAVGGKA